MMLIPLEAAQLAFVIDVFVCLSRNDRLGESCCLSLFACHKMTDWWMTFCIAETLEDLQDLVYDLFEDIPNK